MKWVLLIGAILCEVAASLSLKGSATAPALYAVVVAGYLVAFVLLTLVLRRGVPIGVAYGIWGAGGVALTAGASALFFDEAFTGIMIVGLALVVVGVVVLELGSGAASHGAASQSAASHGASPESSPAEPHSTTDGA